MELEVYQRNVSVILKKRTTANRIYLEFLKFLTLNNLGGPGAGQYSGDELLRYSSCLQFAGYDNSTILTRLRHIEGETRRAALRGGISCKMVYSFFAEAKARSGSKHALDAEQSTLVAALSGAPSCASRTQLGLILLTGVRNMDIDGFGDLRFVRGSTHQWEVFADVTIAKQRKSPEDKTLLQLKGATCMFHLFDTSLQRDLVAWDKAITPFVQVGTMLRWMKSLPALKSFTTYSFRRCFIHAIIQAFTRENGSVDWPSVTQFTLHFSEKSVKSVYAKKAKELHPRNSVVDDDV
jgi:hypothetical protein